LKRLGYFIATAMLALTPRLASAAAVFTLPANVSVDQGSSNVFFEVLITTDTQYQVWGFTMDVALTPGVDSSGVSFSGASDDTSANYVLFENTDTFALFASNTATDLGGSSTAQNAPLYVVDPAGTYSMVQVGLTASPTATGTYTISFVSDPSNNELTVTNNGGPSDLPATVTSTTTITIVPVPEPSSLLLLAPAAGLGARRRRQRH
jgi:hypothetical protein